VLAVTSPNNGATGFSAVWSQVGDEAVLAVQGEVNPRTATVLTSELEKSIVRGNRLIVLDLGEVKFIDGSGLAAITKAAEGLALIGGVLTVRSAPPAVRRLLEITGVASLRVDEAKPEVRGLEELIGAGSMSVHTAEESHHLVSAPTVSFQTSDQLLDRTLRLVVALAHAAVGGADGVSVSLQRRGRLATVAATDQTISDMDANQYATGEGPCIDASVEGRRFYAESLHLETRWPSFTPRALTLGINAILSSPLLVQDRSVGALNIYSRTASAFGPGDQDLAAIFASEASTVLTDVGLDEAGDMVSTRYREALRTREVIAQAQGALMERHGEEEAQAYSRLRRLSLDEERPLRETAHSVVASTGQTPSSAAEPNAQRPHDR
jgi:anti-anti-sigma factor